MSSPKDPQDDVQDKDDQDELDDAQAGDEKGMLVSPIAVAAVPSRAIVL